MQKAMHSTCDGAENRKNTGSIVKRKNVDTKISSLHAISLHSPRIFVLWPGTYIFQVNP